MRNMPKEEISGEALPIALSTIPRKAKRSQPRVTLRISPGRRDYSQLSNSIPTKQEMIQSKPRPLGKETALNGERLLLRFPALAMNSVGESLSTPMLVFIRS